jgi:hypothetical protein
MIGASRRGVRMKLRIAIWAFVPHISPLALILANVLCPVVGLASHHLISFYLAGAINAATYALIGLAVELVRRYYIRNRLMSR